MVTYKHTFRPFDLLDRICLIASLYPHKRIHLLHFLSSEYIKIEFWRCLRAPTGPRISSLILFVLLCLKKGDASITHQEANRSSLKAPIYPYPQLTRTSQNFCSFYLVKPLPLPHPTFTVILPPRNPQPGILTQFTDV